MTHGIYWFSLDEIPFWKEARPPGARAGHVRGGGQAQAMCKARAGCLTCLRECQPPVTANPSRPALGKHRASQWETGCALLFQATQLWSWPEQQVSKSAIPSLPGNGWVGMHAHTPLSYPLLHWAATTLKAALLSSAIPGHSKSHDYLNQQIHVVVR